MKYIVQGNISISYSRLKMNVNETKMMEEAINIFKQNTTVNKTRR